MSNHVINVDTININKSGSEKRTVELKTSGTFVDRNIDVVVNVNTPAGALNNAPTEGVTYSENTDASTVIPANGKLYINAGYYPNTSVSLGQMIPDDVDYTNAGNGHIRAGYEAYDTNGNKLIGTIPDVTPEFTGGAVTATASGSVSKKPTLSVSKGGSVTTKGADYGVTTTEPTGTAGTDYLTLGVNYTAGAGSVTAKANASRTAVTYSKATTGYVNVASGTTASASASATQDTSSVSVSTSYTDNFGTLYFPVVSPTFGGGGVSATAGGSVKTAPSVKVEKEGSLFTTTSYGVTTTKPSGTDGTNYLTIGGKGTPINGEVTATADAHRNAVTYTNSAGLVADHNGASALGAGDATQNTKAVTVTPSVDDQFSDHYIPIVTTSVTGGDVSLSFDNNKIVNAPSVASSFDGTAVDISTDEKPTGTDGTDYYTIKIKNTTQNGSVGVIATAIRTAISESHSAGVISSHSGTVISADSDTSACSVDVYANATLDSDRYITKGSVSPTYTVNGNGTIMSTINVSSSVSNSSYSKSGILTSAPTNGVPYVTIAPTSTNSNGQITLTPKATVTEGYVKADTVSSSMRTIVVSTGSTVGGRAYIPIYTGSYSVSTT